MTQHCDDWSPYYNTLVGQFEYWTLTIMREAFRRNLDNWPSTYYGGLNSIDLYLNHPSYSPFWKQPSYCKGIEPTEWRSDTADYVAEQFRREKEHLPRQVLVQELVWCEECGAKPVECCRHQPSEVPTLPHKKRLARYRRGIFTDKELAAMAKNLDALRLPSLNGQ